MLQVCISLEPFARNVHDKKWQLRFTIVGHIERNARVPAKRAQLNGVVKPRQRLFEDIIPEIDVHYQVNHLGQIVRQE